MFNYHIDGNDQNIMIDGFELKVVTSYMYLSQLASTDSSITGDWFRLASFWKALVHIQKKISELSKTPRLQPAITYGSETWNLTQKFRSTQRAHEKVMLGYKLKDRKRVSWIREQTKLNNLVQATKSAKWKWAGFVQRLTDNRWTKK